MTDKTILVVDDSPQNIQIMTNYLKADYRVRAATNGQKALALAAAAEGRPDLILLDVMMPGLDGYEVCRRLKADPATAGIPVIFLTARTGSEHEAEGFRHGAVDYVYKPFDSATLGARIRTQIALRDALRAAEQAQRQADELLETVLPRAAAEEIRTTGCVIPRRYEDVAVLFCDLANFTSYCDRHQPEDVVARLDALFVRFEDIARSRGMEKIKTIGDAFMAAANLLCPNDDPVASAVRCGLEMEAATRDIGLGWSARVGVHAGPVVAGVVGQERFQFDIWGDTVNVAARMAGKGEPGTVAVTEDVWSRISNRFDAVSLERQEVKGKGQIVIYQIRGLCA